MIKAIIFDYDDTLVLTFKTYVEHDIEVCRFLGINEPSRFQYERVWGLPWLEIIKQIHPDVNPKKFVETFEKVHANKSTPEVMGIKDLFWRLNKEFYVLGVISSKPSKPLQQKLDYFNIRKYLAFVLGAQDTQYHKPDPRVFKEALELINSAFENPSEVAYVGDLVVDAVAAKGAGLTFVGVLTGPTSKTEFLDAGVPFNNVLNDVTELPEWLDEQKQKTS